MLETIGKTLAKARHSKQLTVEDAEHATCIPHERIRELEGDDYSHFANLTYAKSFLKLYSDYLGVDTSEYRHELSLYEVDDFGSDPLSNEFAKEDEPKKAPQILSRLVLLLLVAAMGAFVYVEFFDQRNGADPKEGNPEVVKSPDPDEVLPGPGAKPPGGIPSKVTPDAAVAKIPENPEDIPPKDPEVIEVLPSLPIPEDVEKVKIGGEELPVLPAVVIEDDELLNPPPADGGNGEEDSGDSDTPEDTDSPDIAVADGETGQDEPDGDGAGTGDSEEGDSRDSGTGAGEPTEENPEVGDPADGNAGEGEPVEGEGGQGEPTEEEPEQDEAMEEEAGGEGSGDVGSETESDDPAEDDPAEDDSDAGDTTDAGAGESGADEDGTGESGSGENDPVEDDSDASDAGSEEGGDGEPEPGDTDPVEGDSEPNDLTETETDAGDGESEEGD